MLKLNIFFEASYIELGIFARQNFLSLFISDGEEMDATMTVTAELIDKIKTMTVMCFGYTEEIKVFFLKQLELNIGKKLFLVDNMMGTTKSDRDFLFRLVSLLNEGFSLADAKSMATTEFNMTEI